MNRIDADSLPLRDEVAGCFCCGRPPRRAFADFVWYSPFERFQQATLHASFHPMKKGITQESKELRRHLLSHNGPDVVERMQQSGMVDPVGMIIEMTDEIGKLLTYAALEKQGMPRHEIPELIASYCKDAIPTFKCVVSFETALNILPLTSETAAQNLKGPRRPGTHWIVVVAGGGNSYAACSVGSV